LYAFFRDPTRQDALAALQHPLHQVKGALTMLGETRAAGVLAECSAAIKHFAQPGSTPQPGDFEEVARKLSALGFFVTRLEQGGANADNFFGPPPADAQAIQSEDDALDAELLEIFLEEAHEVLATITAQLPQVHAAPGNHDALVVVRRGFHTLKGSGRMVGLHDLGEAAWAVEQVMNRWLDEARAATPALLEMLDLAAAVFNAWVTQLTAGGSRQHDAGELLRRCAALGEPAASEVNTPQAPMDAVPPAPTLRDFQNASDITAQQAPQAQESEIQEPLLPPAESPVLPMDQPAPVSAELFAFP
jgi:chemosensory pili system protein ChpA (sensor histidine kinase/response regulator)